MPEKYKHLQVFLNRAFDKADNPDNIFLMVTPESFGKVQLLDLNYENDHIFLRLKDLQANLEGNVRIDVNSEKQALFFINWGDVKSMVLDEIINDKNIDLLEFE